MNGVLIVDKPAGWTSFDVVAKLRRLSGERKIGHAGTLDPMATGVLPLLLGRGAKAMELLPDTTKSYTASFRFGEKTDTGDVTGTVIERSAVVPSARALADAAAAYTGEIRQTPPMYSAVSVGGKRLYALARQGIAVERESRPVWIKALEISAYRVTEGAGELRVTCSKGTYIRALIEDIAAQAGTVGMMTALRRTSACGFLEAEALRVSQLEDLTKAGRLPEAIRTTESLFAKYLAVTVSAAQARRFQNGGALEIARLRGQEIPTDEPVRVCSPEQVFLGLGQLDEKREALKVLKLFELK